MDNLELWNKVKQVPKEYLKEIKAGRLRGKSDINPQWRYQAMTEQFGPIGFGWKYEIKKVWTEPGPANQVFCFAEIYLYYKPPTLSFITAPAGEIKTSTPLPWSDPIPGIGGHMLVVQESSGLHANDEGYKMAITDALSVAMKMLGFGADVYAGLWDGSKYRDTTKNTTQKQTKTNPTSEASKAPSASSGDVAQGQHWCAEHNCAFFKMEKDGKTWYSHKKKEGGWCNEAKFKAGGEKDDPYQPIRAAGALRGLNTDELILKELGVDSFDKVTPEYALSRIEEIPPF